MCTRQLVTYTDEIAAFADVGAQVLALSPQSVESHREFAADNGGFAFPLLADEGKAVGLAYGIVGPLGFYRRSVFVVDERRDHRLDPPGRGRALVPALRRDPRRAGLIQGVPGQNENASRSALCRADGIGHDVATSTTGPRHLHRTPFHPGG